MSEQSIAPQKKPKKAKKKVAKVSRWLHIYLSMVSFAVVLFFSVTGLTLNHADFFAGKTVSSKDTGTLAPAWVNVQDTNKIAKLNIAEFFRNKHKVKGAVSDFRIDDAQVSISYRGPGYEGDAYIDRQTGAYELSQTRGSFVAFMNDLHKGRDTGTAWSWVIDVSAVFLVLISLSGLILLLFIKKKRMSGLILLVIGLVLIWLIYKLWGQ
ncbi:peptidase [Sediminibacterium roseum]|uniref:Peptidase n=1 Tax=Sediminibacterium roseum TaxID=1978412 RepID=A0ABW9ZYM5_9BACT|nr:PepSY-associated TM helix domain-containing protein [Sediminibacterium roseum]NCI51645.1 peptidase [Sediminibacterium roseum]